MEWSGPLGYTCAMALATLFAWSAVGKLAAHRGTVARLRAGGVHLPVAVAAVDPLVELALAFLLLARPADGGAAAIVVLALFHLVLAWDIRSRTGCAWFGSARPQPVSGVAVAHNFGLAVLAVGALGAGPGARMPGLAEVVLVTTTVLLGMVLLTLGDLRRRLALVAAGTGPAAGAGR
jgi:hypothetical protein